MIEIKFRGKIKYNGNHKFNGEWIYGYYRNNDNGNGFITETLDDMDNYIFEETEVDENTVCQYTGLHDKNGKEIYEGDIVKAYFKKGAWKWNDTDYYGYKNGKIEYCVDGYILYIENYKEKIYPLSSFGNNNEDIQDLEVIGNIYENPELLEKEV